MAEFPVIRFRWRRMGRKGSAGNRGPKQTRDQREDNQVSQEQETQYPNHADIPSKPPPPGCAESQVEHTAAEKVAIS